jgi:hypothetical protein
MNNALDAEHVRRRAAQTVAISVAGAAIAAKGAAPGFGAAGVVFSVVDGLCVEVQQVGDSAGPATTAAGGSAHGASGVRLVSEADGAVAAAPVFHGANLVGQLDSRQDQVSAGKAK